MPLRDFSCGTPLFITVLALFSASHASLADSDQDLTARAKVLYAVQLGDSESEVNQRLAEFYSPARTNHLKLYPWNRLIPHTNGLVVSEWEWKQTNASAETDVIFAVFSDQEKTNLIDALWYKSKNIRPLVDGVYNRNLRAIEPGNSVRELYENVGRGFCEYYQVEDESWRVRFTYWTYQGRMIIIEADAGTGVIVKSTVDRIY